MPNKGYKQTIDHRKKHSISVMGKNNPNYAVIMSKEQRLKISKSHVGLKGLSGEKGANWLGDNVGYAGIHQWLRLMFGSPKICEKCGTKNAKKYEWANITGIYKRERKNFMRMCTSCHHRLDKTIRNIHWMNYGKKISIPETN
jgi:hypothetical protein